MTSTSEKPTTKIRTQKGPNLPLYMIPIMLGSCGVLFARQLPNPVAQIVVILISVATPSFALGILLTRSQSTGFQRAFLIGSVIMLIVGAMVNASNLPDSVAGLADVPKMVLDVSRWVGLTSLVVGLLAILFILARREEQIEEMVQRFSYLAEHLNEGFILTSPDGVVTLVNMALLELTGLKKEDVLGQNSNELTNALNVQPMPNQTASPQRGLPAEYALNWQVRGEERRLWFSTTPLFNRSGEFAGALATVRDITEQHRLAQRLERYTEELQVLVEDRTQRLYQSEQQFRELLVHMNEGFITLDDQYRVRFANARMGDMLQLSVEDVIGQDVLEFVEPSGQARLVELFEEAHTSYAKQLQCELNLIRPGGTTIQAVAAVAPVKEAADRETRFSLVLTDVSDLIRMQVQLEQRAHELEEANAELRMLDRAKDGFLANVSHELRTPLSTVRGYVEMLEAGSLGLLQGPQLGALQVLNRNVERLGTLIDEMIEFSRMEVRGIRLHLTLFSVGTLIRECAASIRPQANAKGITVSITCAADLRWMWGDRKRIAQVLVVFLTNAVKFSEKDDAVQIEGSIRADGTVALTVSDAGIGIHPDLHKRVFDKFFQVDSSLARRYEGAGIGLSIAKSISEAHGGTIELESAPNKGSAFTVAIPNSNFPTGTVGTATHHDSQTRILLILGDTEYADGLKSVLYEAGFSVHVATGGHEGVREAQELIPSLVVIDETLEDLNGAEILSRLHANPSTAEIGAILLSGKDGIGRETPLPAASTVHVLTKPFSPRKLIAKVRHALGQGPSVDESPDMLLAQGNSIFKGCVITVGVDNDLQEWIGTALARRRFVGKQARDLAHARELAKERLPDVLIVDIDNSESERDEWVSEALSLGTELGAPVYVLTGLPVDFSDATQLAGILRKPFSLQDISAVLAGAHTPAGSALR